MTAVIETRGLAKRYGTRWALTDCTLSLPPGHVTGLVGPNGAGKTTLLNLVTGLLRPTAGTIRVAGGKPAANPAQLAKVGFVAQDTPTYAGFSVADHLRLGSHLNPRWDPKLAQDRIRKLGLDPRQKAGRLSGGQRAQLALALALAKRPELLILDEPVASLDPLARRDFLQDLREATAEYQMSIVLSSHLVADVQRACDYLIVLASSRIQLAGPVKDLLARHYKLSGPPPNPATLPPGLTVISASRNSVIVRADGVVRDPVWAGAPASLEDMVLAYMTNAATTHSAVPEVVR